MQLSRRRPFVAIGHHQQTNGGESDPLGLLKNDKLIGATTMMFYFASIQSHFYKNLLKNEQYQKTQEKEVKHCP